MHRAYLPVWRDIDLNMLAVGRSVIKYLGLLLEGARRHCKKFLLHCFWSTLNSNQEVDVLISISGTSATRNSFGIYNINNSIQ